MSRRGQPRGLLALDRYGLALLSWTRALIPVPVRRLLSAGGGAPRGCCHLEPGDQPLELVDHGTCVSDCRPDAVAVSSGPTSPAGDLAFDQPAEGDAHWRCSESGSVGRPGFVADLDARHAIPRHPGALLCLVLSLSSASSHVYIVYDASAGETVCGAARSAVKQGHINTLEVLGALGLRARASCLGPVSVRSEIAQAAG
jgi:hypothetical protein